MATRTHSPRDELTITPKPWMLCSLYYIQRKKKKRCIRIYGAPFKNSCAAYQITAGASNLYPVPSWIFHLSEKKKKKKKTHGHFTAFLLGTLNLYIQLSFFFSPFDVCIRMTTLLYICASQDFRNIGSLDSLSTSFASFSFVYGTRTAKTLCAVFLNWAGQGRPPNKSFRSVWVYQLVTSIRSLF